MIDYEITIDIEGFSEEKKKRVQDAYFKMGIDWSGEGTTYQELDRIMYTNTYQDGDVRNHLMYVSFPRGRTATHTYEQLMELAGMNDKKVFTKDDLKDGHVVFYDKTKFIFFGNSLLNIYGSHSIGEINLSLIEKVETLEGEVLYEREQFIELNDGQTISVKELKRMSEGNYSDIIPKMARYILDAEGL